MVSFGVLRISAAEKDTKPAAKAEKVDLNKATEEELMELPGVGEVTAKKIIANRPYKTVEDLSKAGLSEAKIAKLAPLVKEGHDAAHHTAAAKEPAAPAHAEKIDINSATADELDELPGVGPATAEKIIKGRPYKTGEDLVKAGVSQKEVDKITPLITFGKAHATEAPKTHAAKTDKTDKTDKGDTKPAAKNSKHETTTTEAQVPPEKGMVWVNLDTKVFHREGDRWYGKTKDGKFMSEEDAVKMGARASKQEPPK
jgi:DNA uptake protein ComE-like DNA-binding protein